MTDRQMLVAALAGRMAPAVVDAYVADLVVRERVTPEALCFLRAGSMHAPPAVVARHVALPILGAAGWTLAVADTKTGKTTVLVGPRAERGDDGGVDMLAWAEHMATHDGMVPASRLDPIGVRLRLDLMLRHAATAPPLAQKLTSQPVVQADLCDAHRAISDDTVDCCLEKLQRGVDAAAVRFMRCAEVVTWCAAKHTCSFEKDAPAMLEAYRKEVGSRLRSARCVAMPVHAAAHWMLLVAHPESGAFYVLDSMGATGTEHAAVAACRMLAPDTCGGMRLERVPVPHQNDGVSCGIFMLCFAEALASSGGGVPTCWRGMRVDAESARARFAQLVAV